MSQKFENQNVAEIQKPQLSEWRKNLSKNAFYKQKSCNLFLQLQKMLRM